MVDSASEERRNRCNFADEDRFQQDIRVIGTPIELSALVHALLYALYCEHSILAGQ